MNKNKYTRPDGITLFESRVESNIEIAPGAFVLSFKREISFKAGQVIGISTSRDFNVRLYSIASGENEKEIRVLYTVVPEGVLTPKLRYLEKGDELWVSDAFGSFTDTEDPAVWIGTGTGIAPFVSMISSGSTANRILIQGNSTKETIYFKDFFREKLDENYFPCVSRENVPDMFYGRVTDFLKQWDQLPLNHKYYLCGKAEMIIESRDLLISKGVSFGSILSEIYF